LLLVAAILFQVVHDVDYRFSSSAVVFIVCVLSRVSPRLFNPLHHAFYFIVPCLFFSLVFPLCFDFEHRKFLQEVTSDIVEE